MWKGAMKISQLDLPEQHFQFSFHQPPHIANNTRILSDSEEMLNLVYNSMTNICEEAPKYPKTDPPQKSSQKSKDEFTDFLELFDRESSPEKQCESENIITRIQDDQVCESTTKSTPKVCESTGKGEADNIIEKHQYVQSSPTKQCESENIIEQRKDDESTIEDVPKVCESRENGEQLPEENVKSNNEADEAKMSIDRDSWGDDCGSETCKVFEYLRILSTSSCVPSLLKLPDGFLD